MPKHRGTTPRTKDDVYPTPWDLPYRIAERLKQEFGDWVPELVIEPSAGSGVFVYASKLVWPNVPVAAVEIRPEEERNLYANGADWVYIGQFEEFAKHYGPPRRTLAMGNPPFYKAEEHIPILLDMLYPGSRISFLLKLNFDGGKDRARNFWSVPENHYDYKIPIAGRPSFKQTELADNAWDEYADWVWEVGKSGKGETRWPHIFWTPVKEGRRGRRKKADREGAAPGVRDGGGSSPPLSLLPGVGDPQEGLRR